MIKFEQPVTRYAVDHHGEIVEWRVIAIQYNSLQIGPDHWVTPAYRSSETRAGAIENALNTLEQKRDDAHDEMVSAERRIKQIQGLHQDTGYCVVDQDNQILQMGMTRDEARAALLYYQTQGEVVEVAKTSDLIDIA